VIIGCKCFDRHCTRALKHALDDAAFSGCNGNHQHTHLLQHFKHLHLEHWVYSLHADACAGLWHGKNIHYLDGVLIHEVAKHEPHDFHRHTSSPCAQDQ
jgi:hypothetical protein